MRSSSDDHAAGAPARPCAAAGRPAGRMLLMGGFGFMSGLPWQLSGLTLAQWLSESGTSLTAIGLTANLGLPYTLKFMWAPLLDQLRPPPPLRRLGRRRGWLVLIQLLLGLAGVAMSATDPSRNPATTVAAAGFIAFLSASQDIVIDAWRIESFPERVQGAALACYVWGYRLALLASGAGAIGLVKYAGWSGALLTVAAVLFAGTVVTLAAREPPRVAVAAARSFAGQLKRSVVEPFTEFWQRPGALPVLAFVMLFKLGEALAHRMAIPFYRALGFDRAQVALATGVPGLVASLAGAALGGWLVIRIGTGRALVLTGFAQMATMFLYFALAVSGGDTRVLLTKIVVENVVEAMADAAFLTYLSSLCASAYTATQYALLSSLAAVGLRTLGGFSGALAQALGWVEFYALTIWAAVPAMLVMLYLLRRPPGRSAPADGA